MNLSLRKRVGGSFIIANLVILILSFTVFHFLNSLNKDIKNITQKSDEVAVLTEEIRIAAVLILKSQRRILTRTAQADELTKLDDRCARIVSNLQTLETHYREPEMTKLITKMLVFTNELRDKLSKASLYNRDRSGIVEVGESVDKILDSFTKFQEYQSNLNSERSEKLEQVINETKRIMMITLIIAFLGTIILGLVVPGKIALPFKKIKDAIRELQECNFDVSIYYNQDDEIGEIAREMNKMIHSFKVFEELRTDRISVENRKFDALANMVKKPVLLANADGKLIYLNNHLYSILQVQSEDVIGKVMTDTVIPSTIIETYNLAIKRRSKIENSEIVIPMKKDGLEEDSENDSEGSRNGEDKTEEVLFQGYANVIPVRGKDSSLDYYLMVMSTELFV